MPIVPDLFSKKESLPQIPCGRDGQAGVCLLIPSDVAEISPPHLYILYC